MKKLILKLIIAVLIILSLIFGGFYVYRYHTVSPMQDITYKKAILESSGNFSYTLEALRPLMGPEELAEFIKSNNNNPEIYTPSNENIQSAKFRANLHMHTTMSDGIKTVKQRMDEAQNYAKNKIKDGYMIIAITDHNTILGAKEVIEVLENNRNKYKNIKVVPGIEINTQFHNSKNTDKPIDIHVLTWSINPYDKFLEEEFFKKDLKDKWNYKFPPRDFDWVIRTMSNFGIVGVAHPARYTEFMQDKKYPYITEMLSRYKELNPTVKFTEGYYQSYKKTYTGYLLGDEYNKYIDYINKEAERLGIIRTGSTDAHGHTIFDYK